MNSYHYLLRMIAMGWLLLGTLVVAQSPTPPPLDLTLTSTGQSSGDATKPNVQVKLSNVSGRDFQVLQPRSDGMLQNLQFMVE